MHHRGFGFHADLCAPGILELLAPVPRARRARPRDRVRERAADALPGRRRAPRPRDRRVARDARPGPGHRARSRSDRAAHAAGRPVARGRRGGVDRPRAQLPPDAPTRSSARCVALARALRPGGVLRDRPRATCEWATARVGEHERSRVGDDWAIITRFSQPSPDRLRARHDDLRAQRGRFVAARRRAPRQRDDRHRACSRPARRRRASTVEVRDSFGTEQLPGRSARHRRRRRP